MTIVMPEDELTEELDNLKTKKNWRGGEENLLNIKGVNGQRWTSVKYSLMILSQTSY